MYAIVEINGQQFKAEQGKKLFVHHIKDAQEGQTVEFNKVLLVDNEGSVQVGAPAVEGAKVVCEVVNPLVKGETGMPHTTRTTASARAARALLTCARAFRYRSVSPA